MSAIELRQDNMVGGRCRWKTMALMVMLWLWWGGWCVVETRGDGVDVGIKTKHVEAGCHADIANEEGVERCHVETLVANRYLDPHHGESLTGLSSGESLGILEETIRLVEENYYLSFDVRKKIGSVLCQLEVLIDGDYAGGMSEETRSDLRDILAEKRQLLARLDEVSLGVLVDWAYEMTVKGDEGGGSGAWLGAETAYALADSLDDYSHLLNPRRYEDIQKQFQGEYTGIGIDVINRGAEPMVFDVVAKSAAARCDIRPGDVLVRADGVLLGGLSDAELSKALGGLSNSELRLEIRRGEALLTKVLRREQVWAPSVRQEQFLGVDGDVGYVRVARFERGTAMELRRSLTVFEQRGVRGVIIDLRHNQGGLLQGGVDCADLFLRRGTIVRVVSRGKQKVYEARDCMTQECELPVILLVNGQTASAAELFAGALQRHHRACLVGEKTFGKGIVQTIYPLGKTVLGICLTTAGYMPGDGGSFHGKGLEPDLMVEGMEAVTSAVEMTRANNAVIREALGFFAAGDTSVVRRYEDGEIAASISAVECESQAVLGREIRH